MFYQTAAGAEILITLIFIGRYVYLEPALKRRVTGIRFGFLFLMTEMGMQIVLGASDGASVAGAAAFFSLYVVLTRREHRLRGCFLLIPVLGILMAPLSLINAVPYTLTGVDLSGNRKISFVLDILFWIGMISFYFFGKKFRERFREEIVHRRLGRWERNFLHGAGVFLLTTGSMMLAVGELGLPDGAARLLTGFGSFSAVLLEVSLIALVHQGNKKEYYQYMNDLNEHYLRAEVEHFRAYQENIEDIRRFRHDIRNHLLCLKDLSDRGMEKEMKEYLSGLTQELKKTEVFIHCGNEIADAIVNEKNAVARKRGIMLRVDGMLPGDLSIRPTDLCVIFANALDNALEAQTDEIAEKWIRVGIRHHNEMLNLTFENPVRGTIPDWRPGFTTKQDAKNHGFGMENIKATAGKYQGTVEWSVEEGDNSVYQLNILLFTTKRAPFTT